MKILFAGETPNGSANYLMGIFRHLRADVSHIPSNTILHPHQLSKKFDTIILSDFSRKNAPESSQKLVAEQVFNGTGLLMIGGWASFSGPFGGWSGSVIEKLLPVSCLKKDDRTNFPSGAWVTQNHKHPMFKKISFDHPPVVCGLNRVIPKKNGITLLSARKITQKKSGKQLLLDPQSYPLLVVDSDPRKKIATFTTDFAPHWCGGLLDWGGNLKKLSVTSKISIEVGKTYIQFVSSLMLWLSKSRS